MRILVATDQWFPDFKGGSARVATETARHLAARGHEVVVLTPRGSGSAGEERDGSLTVLRTIRRRGLPQTLMDVVETAGRARRAGGRFDVLVGHQSTTAVGLSRAGLDAPLALVYHASVPRELRFLRTRRPPWPARLRMGILQPAVDLLDRLAVRRAARLLILSEFTRSLLEADHPEQAPAAVRVPGGVDVDAFSPGDGPAAARARLGIDAGARIVLTVRRLEPRMGIEVLLESLVSLPQDVSAVIVGTGRLAAQLAARGRQLGVDGRVRLVGAVSDEELRDWYRAADLFVLPTVAYEGFGMVTAEALASGTPVVGTPVGATPELLEPLDPALVAAGSDAPALADAIARGLELASPAFRTRCREYACTRLAWPQTIGAWEEALAAAAHDPNLRLRRA